VGLAQPGRRLLQLRRLRLQELVCGALAGAVIQSLAVALQVLLHLEQPPEGDASRDEGEEDFQKGVHGFPFGSR
jgi:hypothetical protein